MKTKPRLVILLSFFFFLSCEKNLESDPEPVYPIDSFYFNSFESSSDIDEWYLIGGCEIVEEAPEVGGKYALKVSGGCVIPHAFYRFDPLTEDCSFMLKCWGKNLSHGGSVSLQADNHSGSVHISVSDSSWTNYISKDTLHCKTGSSLVLELNSGGIISSSMLVDQIEITKLDL